LRDRPLLTHLLCNESGAIVMHEVIVSISEKEKELLKKQEENREERL